MQLCSYAGMQEGSKLVRPRRAACSKYPVTAYYRGVSAAVQTLYGCPLQSRGNYRSSIQWATRDGYQIIILPVIGWRVFPNVEAWMWTHCTVLHCDLPEENHVCLTIEKTLGP